MLKDHISDIGHQDEQVTLVADGAYSGIENKELAAENNINLVFSKGLPK